MTVAGPGDGSSRRSWQYTGAAATPLRATCPLSQLMASVSCRKGKRVCRSVAPSRGRGTCTGQVD